MELKTVVLVVTISVSFFEVQSREIVDLTHNFDDTTIYWPTARQWKFRLMDAGSNDDFEYEAYRFCTAEHGGTHLDAPRHFARGQLSAHDVKLDHLIGPLFLVDVSSEARIDKDLLINVQHLKNAETENGRLMNDSIVLLYTGFSHHWPKLNDYLGTNTTNTSLLHFPGLDPAAAQWIVENRSIKSIGIDCASIDYGQSTDYLSHRYLMRNDIPVFENVNLKEVEKLRSQENVEIIALPMKIKGGSGAPLRIVATIN